MNWEFWYNVLIVFCLLGSVVLNTLAIREIRRNR